MKSQAEAFVESQVFPQEMPQIFEKRKCLCYN